MRKLEDDDRPEDIQQMREAMEQLRERQRENKQNARRAYEDMKRRDPEFWKAFGFATEAEYLRYYDLDHLLNPNL